MNKAVLIVASVVGVAVLGGVAVAPRLGRSTGEKHFAALASLQPTETRMAPPDQPPAPLAAATPPPTSGPIPVKAADFGDEWPFKPPITEGAVDCIEGHRSIFIADGTRYALSGSARGKATMERLGLVDFHTIWRDNPKPGYEGTKIFIGDMITLARKRCTM